MVMRCTQRDRHVHLGYQFNELAHCLDSFKEWIEKGVIKAPSIHCVDMELLCRQLVAHGFLSIWHMFAGRAQQTN